MYSVSGDMINGLSIGISENRSGGDSNMEKKKFVLRIVRGG